MGKKKNTQSEKVRKPRLTKKEKRKLLYRKPIENLSEDTFKKTKEKLDRKELKLSKKDLAKINKLVNEGAGTKYIRSSIGNRLTQEEINNLKKAMGGVVEDLNTRILNKKFFFNYRGGWFFDLIINRKLSNNKDDTQVKYYGIFLNGNTGWVKAYEVDNKKKNDLTNIFHRFITGCSHLNVDGHIINYPVKMIISDNESGVPNKEFEGVQIQKITQSRTAHTALARINAFASHLRKRYKDNVYISPDDLSDFIESWNNSQIPTIVCSRNEMMIDEDLEEAYIASCLYYNHDVDEDTKEIFKADDKVRIIEKNDIAKSDNQKFGKELTDTYKIISNNNGNIKLENINDSSDVREVRSNAISKRVYDVNFDWKDYFGMTDEDFKPKKRTVSLVEPLKRSKKELEKNKRETEMRKKYKSPMKYREVKELEEGMERQEDRTKAQKNREDNELKEGEKQAGIIKKLNSRLQQQQEQKALEDVFKDLPQSEKIRIAMKINDLERDKNFDLGFITNFTAKEMYENIDNFLNNMSPEKRNAILGELQIFPMFNSKNKLNLSDRKRNYLKYSLLDYFESPEYREFRGANKNDFEAMLSGHFTKNNTKIE